MSELRRPLATFGDDELGAELRALAAWLDTPATPPTGAPDPARRARLRIESGSARAERSWWPFARGGGRGPVWRPTITFFETLNLANRLEIHFAICAVEVREFARQTFTENETRNLAGLIDFR
jgi:hypothetical protein